MIYETCVPNVLAFVSKMYPWPKFRGLAHGLIYRTVAKFIRRRRKRATATTIRPIIGQREHDPSITYCADGSSVSRLVLTDMSTVLNNIPLKWLGKTLHVVTSLLNL